MLVAEAIRSCASLIDAAQKQLSSRNRTSNATCTLFRKNAPIASCANVEPTPCVLDAAQLIDRGGSFPVLSRGQRFAPDDIHVRNRVTPLAFLALSSAGFDSSAPA